MEDGVCFKIYEWSPQCQSVVTARGSAVLKVEDPAFLSKHQSCFSALVNSVEKEREKGW